MMPVSGDEGAGLNACRSKPVGMRHLVETLDVLLAATPQVPTVHTA